MKACKKCGKVPTWQTRRKFHEADIAAGGPGVELSVHLASPPGVTPHPVPPYDNGTDERLIASCPEGCHTPWNLADKRADTEALWNKLKA